MNHKPPDKVNSGAEVSQSFNNWKLFYHDSDYMNLDLYWVKDVSYDVIEENPSTNLLYNCPTLAKKIINAREKA